MWPPLGLNLSFGKRDRRAREGPQEDDPRPCKLRRLFETVSQAATERAEKRRRLQKNEDDEAGTTQRASFVLQKLPSAWWRSEELGGCRLWEPVGKALEDTLSQRLQPHWWLGSFFKHLLQSATRRWGGRRRRRCLEDGTAVHLEDSACNDQCLDSPMR